MQFNELSKLVTVNSSRAKKKHDGDGNDWDECKLLIHLAPVKYHHLPACQHSFFIQGLMPFLPPNQQC